MTMIPYSHQCIDEGDINEVVEVLRSEWITQGPKVGEFEEALSGYTGAKYAVAVSNGTAALHLACLAAGLEQGDEAITSSISFVASANCIVYCGGKPVLADVDKDTINIDPQEIDKRIGERTKVILPVHFGGHPCDLEAIQQIALKNGLTVIEDGAHALGAEYKGSKIGSCKYSDMTIFSFHPVKSITTGEGGAILTNRKDLYEKLIMLRNHGVTRSREEFANDRSLLLNAGDWYYEVQKLGFNYRLTDIQAALGKNQLKKLDDFIERRRVLVEFYKRELSESAAIRLPVERPYVRSAYHLYYIQLVDLERRKKVFDTLRAAGIGVQVHYIPIHLQPYYREKFGYGEGDYPNAERYYRSAVSLPLYPNLSKDDIDHVIRNLRLCELV